MSDLAASRLSPPYLPGCSQSLQQVRNSQHAVQISSTSLQRCTCAHWSLASARGQASGTQDTQVTDSPRVASMLRGFESYPNACQPSRPRSLPLASQLNGLPLPYSLPRPQLFSFHSASGVSSAPCHRHVFRNGAAAFSTLTRLHRRVLHCPGRAAFVRRSGRQCGKGAL